MIRLKKNWIQFRTLFWTVQLPYCLRVQDRSIHHLLRSVRSSPTSNDSTVWIPEFRDAILSHNFKWKADCSHHTWALQTEPVEMITAPFSQAHLTLDTSFFFFFASSLPESGCGTSSSSCRGSSFSHWLMSSSLRSSSEEENTGQSITTTRHGSSSWNKCEENVKGTDAWRVLTLDRCITTTNKDHRSTLSYE